MATRKSRVSIESGMDESVFEWAIVGSDSGMTTWRHAKSNEEVTLPDKMRPTPSVLDAIDANRQTGNDDTPPATGLPFEFSEIEDEGPASPLERVITIIGRDGSLNRADVKVYRMRDGQKDAYCAQYTADEFEDQNLELIRAHFGPGKYRIKIYGTSEQQPKYSLRLNEVVEIEGSLVPLKQTENAGGMSQAALIQMLQTRNENPIQQNPMNQMKEMLQMMVLMKQVMGGDHQPKSSVSELVQAIRELKGAQELIAPESSGDGGMMGMAKDIIGLVAQNQQVQQQQPPAQIPYIAVPQQPVPTLPENPAFQQNPIEQPETTDDPDMNKFLMKTMIGAIIKQAEQNKPVEPIAADLYLKLPDEALDMIESVMWFDLLAELHPGVRAHETWFTQLRTAIVAEIASDTATD